MKWGKAIADHKGLGRLRWTVAWWLEGGNQNPLTYNGEEMYLVKLRGKKGYYLCSYPHNGDVEVIEFGPFPTLRLAKTTYLMVARSPE